MAVDAQVRSCKHWPISLGDADKIQAKLREDKKLWTMRKDTLAFRIGTCCEQL